ncbi:hypothetical protein KVR01_009687 [Diaporthe batatas]|uniref:uncharacterized protein n=1 Tax=Diaporthe batatas TaxID=748121 RepID=UPI001D041CFC|nr:uncharacterized protein KVR01_009687 [Diaporthe batatas]KAG8160151.1 hypothetical protein KVR01_009687 [Diaporthe batatas]
MSGIGLQSSAKVNEPKNKTRQPKTKKKGKDSRQPTEGNVTETWPAPKESAHRSELGEGNTRSGWNRERSLSQGRRNSGSQTLSGHLQADRGQEADHVNSAAFQKMERQALRRRKVEALESLAHTAALFLAEFIDYKKGRQEPSRQGLEQHQSEPGTGVAYAAAAASLFRPLSEFDRSGYNSAGSMMDQPSSSPDGSDDEYIQASTPAEEKGGRGMDNGESDQSPPLVASLGTVEQAGASEPGVKIEEH